MPLKMHQKSHESKPKFRLFTALFGVVSFTALSYDKANSKQIQSDFKVKFKTFFKINLKAFSKHFQKANSACVFSNCVFQKFSQKIQIVDIVLLQFYHTN